MKPPGDLCERIVTAPFLMEPEAAKALIRFLSGPGAAPTLRAKGVEPN